MQLILFVYINLFRAERMQEVTFEEGSRNIPTLISTSQQTPPLSVRPKETIKNNLSVQVLENYPTICEHAA